MTLTRASAQEFSESFGMIGAGWYRQIAWAKQQGIPDALDLSTREWVERYVGGWARLAIEDRREAVKELTTSEDDGGMGMSQREAADVLGVSAGTVANDAAALNVEQPDPLAEYEPEPMPLNVEQPDASGDADILVTYMSGLTDMPRSAKPRDLAASLNVPNRRAFAKRLLRVSRYLAAVAQEIEEES